MNNIKRPLFLALIVIFIGGCTTLSGKNLEMEVTPKRYYEFDLSSTNHPTNVILRAFPPSQQFAVTYYVLSLDGHEPVQILKHSECKISLDPGNHTLTIYAIPNTFKGIYGDSFGKPSTLRFTVKNNEILILEYTGPFWMWSKGVLVKK